MKLLKVLIFFTIFLSKNCILTACSHTGYTGCPDEFSMNHFAHQQPKKCQKCIESELKGKAELKRKKESEKLLKAHYKEQQKQAALNFLTTIPTGNENQPNSAAANAASKPLASAAATTVKNPNAKKDNAST